MALDEIDEQIVRLLTDDGRMSYSDLGEKVSRIDRRLRALIDIRLRSPDHAAQFERLVQGNPGVEEAVHLTGPSDYVIRIAVADPTELDDFIRALKEDGGVRDTQTRLILRIVS